MLSPNTVTLQWWGFTQKFQGYNQSTAPGVLGRRQIEKTTNNIGLRSDTGCNVDEPGDVVLSDRSQTQKDKSRLTPFK